MKPKRFGPIIVAMRRGTTTFFSPVEQHRQVAPGRIKESRYLCGDDCRVEATWELFR